MAHRRWARRILVLFVTVSALFLAPARGQEKPKSSGGRTRTYYVAADEVNWNYAPAGRDEAMGMPFDDIWLC